MDQLNRMISEQWAQDHPGTESPMFHLFGTEDLPPSQINERPTRRPLTKPFDDLYPYRKSTKWPPITHNTYTTSPLPTDDWLTDYKKNLDKTVENFERNTHIQEQRINYYNTDFAKQLKNIEFKVFVKLNFIRPASLAKWLNGWLLRCMLQVPCVHRPDICID